jgi:lipoprotein-anchoring transpeptidase ErfK/SrfK
LLLAIAVAVTVWAGLSGDPRGSASIAPLAAHDPAARGDVPVAVRPSPQAAVPHTNVPSPCVHNSKAQLVVVSIERQHEWACARSRTVLSTAVTTGADRPGERTPKGTFAVQGLNRNTTLTTSGDRSYRVRYWIPFHLGVWGFHDASWQKMPFGSAHYRTRGSHGCVHMPLAAIRWLFHWVHYGTPVRIV